jgi:hypothetical protein
VGVGGGGLTIPRQQMSGVFRNLTRTWTDSLVRPEEHKTGSKTGTGGLDRSRSGCGAVAGSSKRGNESSVPIKGGEFISYLNTCSLPRDSVPCTATRYVSDMHQIKRANLSLN